MQAWSLIALLDLISWGEFMYAQKNYLLDVKVLQKMPG